VLSVVPTGFPVSITPTGGIADYYFAGEGVRTNQKFTELTLQNNVLPNDGRAITVRVRVSPDQPISRIVRTRNAEELSLGSGVETVADGAELTLDLRVLAPSLFTGVPSDWTLPIRKTVVSILNAPGAGGAFIVAGTSAGIPIFKAGTIGGAPVEFDSDEAPVLFNNSGDGTVLQCVFLQSFYEEP
jgi:hypothetical protein